MHMVQDSCAHIVARATNCPAGKPTHLTQATGLPPLRHPSPNQSIKSRQPPARTNTSPPVRFSETPPSLPPNNHLKPRRNPTPRRERLGGRVYKTSGNRSGLIGYRSNWFRPVSVWTGTKSTQIQNLNLNSKK